MSEVRVKDPRTGGEKGSKLARFDLIPADVLLQFAEHYGKGAEKYEDRNWERGYAWGLSFAAMMRHAWAFWNGEDIDPETGSHHMIAVMFHAAALVRFTEAHPELDDRSPQGVNKAFITKVLDSLREESARIEWEESVERELDGVPEEAYALPEEFSPYFADPPADILAAIKQARDDFYKPAPFLSDFTWRESVPTVHHLDVWVHDGDEIDVGPDGYMVIHDGGADGEWHEWEDLGGEA